jgi:hypothetical protein
MHRRTCICTTVLLGFVIVSLCASLMLAEPGVVTTHDGQAFEGDVTESGEQVAVTIHGVTTVIPRSRVADVKYRPDYEAEFRERLAKLEEHDVGGRVAMAREAFEARRYELSRDAAEAAMQIDPNSREAHDMLELVQRQIQLERARANSVPARPGAAATTRAAGTAPERPAAVPHGGGDRRFLTADQINTIRQQVLLADDNAARIAFQADVRRTYAKSQGIPFAEFNRHAPVQQALAIVANGTNEMRRQVRVASDPSALAEFKRVQPMILNGCASSACHGGASGGGLILFSPADSDAPAYTNFYILQKYSKKLSDAPAGMFGGGAQRLIDRGHGDDSLLANYGLPTAIATHDHPPVGGRLVQPIFRGKDDPRYQQLVRWMNESLKRDEPDYGIDFPIPSPPKSPATQPATTQAGE